MKRMKSRGRRRESMIVKREHAALNGSVLPLATST